VELGCIHLNSSDAFTWEEANIYCQEKKNATLVEIQTEEQLEFITIVCIFLTILVTLHTMEATWVELGCIHLNSSDAFTWEEANIYCQEKNATLVEIQTEEQLEFLDMLLVLNDHSDSHVCWTAGTDLGVEGHWIWMRSLTEVDFVWGPEQPSNGIHYNCMYLSDDISYTAYDGSCKYSTGNPICQQALLPKRK
jgi:hypothetical protein